MSLWSKITLILFFSVATIANGNDEADLTATYCDGTGWVPYLDEKCFKLIKRWTTRDEAKNACANEWVQTDPSIPQLASIKSLEEQNYLTKYVFDESEVEINVWIGAKRQNSPNFVWDDGSDVEFANWIEGSPSDGAKRDCVEMQSQYVRKFTNETVEIAKDLRSGNGKWRDVTCELPNYVVCEKLQRWSFGKLQQSFLVTRKTLTESLDSVTNELESVKKNPVPIGFLYVQLPNQPEPKALWPNVKWSDVTAEYAGLFFRAEGGGAEQFGKVQSENAPRVTEVRHVGPYGPADGPNWQNTILNVGDWSSGIGVFTGSYNGVDCWLHKFYQSGGEIRPRNMAMRFWKRIG